MKHRTAVNWPLWLKFCQNNELVEPEIIRNVKRILQVEIKHLKRFFSSFLSRAIFDLKKIYAINLKKPEPEKISYVSTFA